MSRDLFDYIVETLRQRGASFVLLIMLADEVRDDCAGVCWPSLKRLRARARLAERTTQGALRKLEADGEIVITYGEAPRGCNLYRLTQWKQSVF